MSAPDKAAEIRAAVTAAIAFGTALFGWVGWVLALWFAAMVLDYITGTLAAMRNGRWNSSVARDGLWHKLGSIAAVCVAALCDIALGIVSENMVGFLDGGEHGFLITPVVAVWYIFTELGSIVENAAAMGAPVPAFLQRIIEKTRNDTEA